MSQSISTKPRRRRADPRALLLLGAVFVAPSLATITSCQSSASCDAVCNNYLDKCTRDGTNTDENACLEECNAHVAAAPSSCSTERDDLLSCIADAESLDCESPESSVACRTEADALDQCESKHGGGAGGAGGTSSSGGASVTSGAGGATQDGGSGSGAGSTS